jgi:hypothetical protein
MTQSQQQLQEPMDLCQAMRMQQEPVPAIEVQPLLGPQLPGQEEAKYYYVTPDSVWNEFTGAPKVADDVAGPFAIRV